MCGWERDAVQNQSKTTDINVDSIVCDVTDMNTDIPIPFRSKYSSHLHAMGKGTNKV